jgi:hypothetical protein
MIPWHAWYPIPEVQVGTLTAGVIPAGTLPRQAF